MAASIQDKEIQGEVYSRNLEREKQATLLGMAQQETAAYQQQASAAEQAKWGAISGGIQGAADMVAGFNDPGSSGLPTPPAGYQYNAQGQLIQITTPPPTTPPE